MKNLLLSGTDNDGKRHRYSISKKESFKKEFIKFLLYLKFEERSCKQVFIKRDFETEEPYEEKINNINDQCRRFKNSNYDIDLFFGKNKIIMLVRIIGKNKQILRNKLTQFMINNSEWQELDQSKIDKNFAYNMKR